ncbi:MAG TPA: cytochrome b, partial [Actinomycetota bacterium]|nr:cytochrome b [Actinomycetota bacterium]
YDVRGGLVLRQMHHWAALLFLAAIIVHMCRIFFTGAFRKPRDINWLVGVTLLLLSMGTAFLGYVLPDDLISGNGLRIAYAILISIPVIGPWLVFLLFGPNYPGTDIMHRFYILHVFVIPVVLLGLLAVHLMLIWRQKHTQFPGPGRTETNVVGSRVWPAYSMRSTGLFLGALAVVGILGGVAQIDPIWLFGHYDPTTISAPAQPDWYLAWVEGALRIYPRWAERSMWTIPVQFFPAVLMPLLTFAGLYAWPWIERAVTGDRLSHQLLDRPRYAPGRTAVGAALLSFYIMLTIDATNDLWAHYFHLSVLAVTWGLRIATLVVPFIVGPVVHQLMRALGRSDADHFIKMPLEPLSHQMQRWKPSRVADRMAGDGGRSSVEEEEPTHGE